MIQKISVEPYQVKKYSCIPLPAQGMLGGFPLLSIDCDSYIVGLDLQSGLNFDPEGGRHCVAIGKGCSISESVTFIIDLTHDYRSVYQGALSHLKDIAPVQKPPAKIPLKGSIIIQNDVWIAHGATVMGGVTLHNGCIVAANAVVTKDVPPYAIVGGNPAKILRYRFSEDIINSLQKIAWWNWSAELCAERRDDFLLPAEDFVEKYLLTSDTYIKMSEMTKASPPPVSQNLERVLFIPDFSEPYPLYPKIFGQYFSKNRLNQELIIYVPERESTPKNLKILEEILSRYENVDCLVTVQSGEDLDEHGLFGYADSFITTRCRETVARTCLADLYNTKLIHGTDEPLFRTY